MTLKKLLVLYKDKIKDWDMDAGSCGEPDWYFIYLKKPYAVNEGQNYTDMITGEINDIPRKMKWVEKIDPVVWDNI